MKIYCKDGYVVACYDDSTNVAPGSHPDTIFMQIKGTLSDLDMEIGDNQLPRYKAPELDLVAYTKNIRWEKEIGGMSFRGMTIATDDRSKLMISGSVSRAVRDPNFTTKWEGTISIDSATMIQIGDALVDFINDLFDKQGEILAAIENGTITTSQQVDEAFA